VHPRLPSGKPDYTRTVPCRCTLDRMDGDRQARLQSYSNLGALTRLTFDNLAPQGKSGHPASRQAFAAAYEAARDFAAEPRGWLVLNGPSGSGKTHLAAAIANERLSQQQPVLYLTTPDLLHHLRNAYNPGSELPHDDFFEQVRTAPLLILDDMGIQSSTAWAREKLDQLITHRTNAALPTVIVTITDIEQLEDRLRSRLTNPDLCRAFKLKDESTAEDYGWGPEFELQKSMTFSSFDWKRVNLPPEQRENLEAAYRLALDFAREPENWLVFMGETGCGKTHLAAAIVNYRYEAGQPAKFVVVPEFLDHLRSTFSPDSKVSYDRLFESVKNAPLLVLDDFGEQSTTPWAREKLYQVINYRYNARLATVITTRFSLEEILEEIDSAVSSRLVDKQISTPFNIMAPDYRGDITSGPVKSRRRGRKSG
jgi:DNA replication protein DnaC